MAVFDRVQAALGRSKGNQDDTNEPAVAVSGGTPNDKEREAGLHPDDASTEAAPVKDAQHGVQTVEAVTLAWSKASLIAAFIM